MRNSYHVARAINVVRVGSGAASTSSFGSVGENFWKKLWAIYVSGKVKICAWRACLDALPTRSKLCKRHVMNEDLCVVCWGKPSLLSMPCEIVH